MRKTTAVLLLGVTFALGCRSQPKGPDIAALVTDLGSPDPAVSGKANLTLIALGAPAVPALTEMLKRDDVRLRRVAASTLWGMGEKAVSAVPALAEALKDDDPGVRAAAATALEMGPPAAPAVPALIQALKDDDMLVRQCAVKSLGAIGPAARAAVPALEQVAKLEGSRVTAEAALAKIRR